MQNKKTYKKKRTSVSAEVYGMFNKKEDFTPPVFPKSEEVKESLLQKLNESILFQNLDAKEKEIIIMATEVKNFSNGD